MSVPPRLRGYPCSRIVQLMPLPAPRWAVWADHPSPDRPDPYFEAPIECYALVDQWESHDIHASVPKPTDEVDRVIRPVYLEDGRDLELIEGDNYLGIVTTWPPTPEEARILTEDARKWLDTNRPSPRPVVPVKGQP